MTDERRKATRQQAQRCTSSVVNIVQMDTGEGTAEWTDWETTTANIEEQNEVLEKLRAEYPHRGVRLVRRTMVQRTLADETEQPCNDCGEPVRYVESEGWYCHTDPEVPNCFLAWAMPEGVS